MSAMLARSEPRALRQIFAGNVAARLAALVALGIATVMVGRVGGPDLVGGFTLLRVLPGLAGVLAVAGLPGAAPYFLSSRPRDGALRPTLVVLTVLGAGLGALGWLALAPLLHRIFFSDWSPLLTVAAASAVFTQVFVAVGKALLQGDGDLPGANVAIVAEEAAYLPVYPLLLVAGRGMGSVLTALVAADILVAAGIGWRLYRRGFFAGWVRPNMRLSAEIAGYGTRGQVGGLLSLVNLRLDVAILGAIAGPGVLGVYAVASKYAELLRLPGLAVTYVLYPVFSQKGREVAAARTRALMLPALGLNALAAVPLAAVAGLVLPWVYGSSFDGAVRPAWILLAGLLGEGVAGLVSAYLYGVGRPGLNSLAVGAGVVVTVIGDILLIRSLGAVGAAIASAVAYLTTTAALLVCFRLASRRSHEARDEPAVA